MPALTQKQGKMLCEQLRVLEQEAMSRIGIDNELRVR